MFRTLRRKKNEISKEETISLLKESRRGVLAMQGDEGYPYAIPVNYFFDEENFKIYFHGAKAGYKYDCLSKCAKICFTVYGQESIKDETWAPFMRSAVIFGQCRLIDDQDRTKELVKKFALKYYPNDEMIDKEIAIAGNVVGIYEISIEHLCGKQVQEK